MAVMRGNGHDQWRLEWACVWCALIWLIQSDNVLKSSANHPIFVHKMPSNIILNPLRMRKCLHFLFPYSFRCCVGCMLEWTCLSTWIHWRSVRLGNHKQHKLRKWTSTAKHSQWHGIYLTNESRWLLQKYYCIDRKNASSSSVRKMDHKTLAIQLEPIIPFHWLSWFYVSFRKVFIMMVLFDSIIEHGHGTTHTHTDTRILFSSCGEQCHGIEIKSFS